jgi:capsular polysaccharide biosynthesis protein
LLTTIDTNKRHSVSSRIFVLRKSKFRNVKNSSTLVSFFKGLGFKVILEETSFIKKQAQIFYFSKLLIAQGGAVMANMFFAGPQTKIVVLRSWRNRRIRLWTELAEILDLDLCEVKGFPTYWRFNYLKRSHSDYLLPIWYLKLRLKLSK